MEERSEDRGVFHSDTLFSSALVVDGASVSRLFFLRDMNNNWLVRRLFLKQHTSD